MNWKTIVAGAAIGFVSALLVDLDAWAKSKPGDGDRLPFDWGLALKRWVAGAVAGATGALGFGGVQ